MFSHQTELHDLKAENERLKDQIHQLQYLVEAAKLEITGKKVVVEQAKAKIAELEQAATTLRQLEELLHTHSLVSFEKIVGNYQTVLPNTGWAWVRKDLPAAIAAAWERREE